MWRWPTPRPSTLHGAAAGKGTPFTPVHPPTPPAMRPPAGPWSPPAPPPVDATTGGSWFTDGTDMPPEAEPAEPAFGPAPPRTSGRASFGFSDGPISPKRSAPTSGAPAGSVPDPEPGLSSGDLPIR